MDDEAQPDVDDEEYLRGPVDKSFLGSYEDHVVRKLLNGVVSKYVEIRYVNITYFVN